MAKPIANDDNFYAVDEDQILTVAASGVLANDTDADNDTLSAVLVSGPDNDLFKLYADGGFVFDASNYDYLSKDETTEDSFTYKARDGQDESDLAATVTITITGVNDDPFAVDDDAATDAATPINIDVLANDTDVDENDNLTLTMINGAGFTVGTPIALASGAEVTVKADDTVDYAPAAGFFGVDSFTYDIGDGNGGTDTATVEVTVTPVNATPVAKDDLYEISEDAGATAISAVKGVLNNDTDADNEPLGAWLVSRPDPTKGEGTLSDFNTDGSFTYDPGDAFQYLKAGAHQDITFNYQAFDGSGAFSEATVTLRITGANDAPVAADDKGHTDEDTVFDSATTKGGLDVKAGATTVLANDTDADLEDLDVAAVTLNGGTTFITDNDGTDTDNTVGVIGFATGKGALVSLDLASGEFTYDPNGKFNALGSGDSDTDSWQYKATDGTADSGLATVTMTINGANDAPVATNDKGHTDEDTVFDSATTTGGLDVKAGATTVLANDTDTDLDDLDVAAVTLDGGTTFITDNDGTDTDNTVGVIGFTTDKGALVSLDLESGQFTYDPNGQFEALGSGDSDTDSWQYKATDGTADSGLATVAMTINGVNDAPVARDDIYTVTNGAVDAPGSILEHQDPGEGSLVPPGDDYDVDGDELSVFKVTFRGENKVMPVTAGDDSVSFTAADGAELTVNEDGTFDYTPVNGFYGTDTFTYTNTDGTEESNEAQVSILVTSAPSLADRLFLNEIALNPDGDNSSTIEIINNFNNAVQSSDLDQVRVEIVNPAGDLIVVDLSTMTNQDGSDLTGSALPGNSFLVLHEPNAKDVGVWEVYSGNSVSEGLYESQQWSLGQTVGDEIAVNLVQGASSIDFFAANDAQLSGLENISGGLNTFLTGLGAFGEARHDLGSAEKGSFELPVRDYPWYSGAQIDQDGADADAALDLYNTQYNGSLGGDDDNVFARAYDRYLKSQKGSSEDNVFIDHNDAGDWTYGGQDAATIGAKNTVWNGNVPAFVANTRDAADDVNPLQGTGLHADVVPDITNEDGQTIAVYSADGHGGAGPDWLYGTDAANELYGEGNNDALFGFGGEDDLDGGAGADLLDGGDDADNLTGGTGGDTMVGGDGPDTFHQADGDSVASSAQDFSVDGDSTDVGVGDTLIFGGGVDIVLDFTAGAGVGHDIFDGANAGAPTSGLGLAVADGFLANVTYFISGDWNPDEHVFTIAENGDGADTAIVEGDGGALGDNDSIVILVEVNSSQLDLTNFV